MTEPVYEFVRGQGWIISPSLDNLPYSASGRYVYMYYIPGGGWNNADWPGSTYDSVGIKERIESSEYLRKWRSNWKYRILPADQESRWTGVTSPEGP